MTDFIQGENRFQSTLLPETLDDYITEDNAVRVIDVFVDELDLSALGFETEPKEMGRPAYLRIPGNVITCSGNVITDSGHRDHRFR